MVGHGICSFILLCTAGVPAVDDSHLALLVIGSGAVGLLHQTGNGVEAESDSASGYQHGVKPCDAGEEPQAFRGAGYRNLYGNAKGAEPDCKRNP